MCPCMNPSLHEIFHMIDTASSLKWFNFAIASQYCKYKSVSYIHKNSTLSLLLEISVLSSSPGWQRQGVLWCRKTLDLEEGLCVSWLPVFQCFIFILLFIDFIKVLYWQRDIIAFCHLELCDYHLFPKILLHSKTFPRVILPVSTLPTHTQNHYISTSMDSSWFIILMLFAEILTIVFIYFYKDLFPISLKTMKYFCGALAD